MNGPELLKAYEEQNRRLYITNATIATLIQIPLNLFCSVMDHFVYPEKWWLFLKVRVGSVILVGLAWIWYKMPLGVSNRRFGVVWIMSPLLMILWMIYAADDRYSPYYAGLNIILLGMGLLTPWAYKQNLFVTLFVVVMYVIVSLATKTPQPIFSIINNTTFLLLTSVIVVSGSVANAGTRYREFTLRWELDKSRREVEESNRKLTELDQAKSRFFANISHELRTPLTLLLAPLENLVHRFSHQFDAPTRELLSTMHANGMRLLKLINDLLDLVRLESGRLEVKRGPVDLAEFARGLMSAVGHVANDKRIRLQTWIDPAIGVVLADRDKLEKVVLNLLFNALKFTPAGGQVELRAEKEAEELVLKLSDTGMGISEKNLINVFSRFWQADDSSRRKFQGVGIGLALVKEFTEIQGGSVSVASKVGHGTTFTVRIPYLKSDAAPVPPPGDQSEEEIVATSTFEQKHSPASEEWLSNLYRRAELFPAMTLVRDAIKTEVAARNRNQPTILVADDEPDMLRFLKSQLIAHYQVLEAVDGQQAIEKACQFLPDIILLDMMMPEKDGLQACKELREKTITQSIPIILLTARADEETKLKALSAGASDFLPKPFSTTELHVRIKNLVQSYHYQRKLSKQNTVLENTIEQLKDTETQLVQTEKLASLGRMSAGIIHEINNPLNFATTGLYTLRNKGKYIAPEQQEEYAEILTDVEDGLKRVKTIVSDLRSFSHSENEQIDQLDVPELITSSLRFLSHEWKDKVQMEQKLSETQTIWGNKNKLIQVCVNLLQNSIDALRSKPAGDEKPTIWIEGREENGRSLLIIRDNGEGIDPQNLDKIFDPFFTTKDVGQGMGLGLSICYRIVQEYEGRILVKSERGKFCEFTLEFPVKG